MPTLSTRPTRGRAVPTHSPPVPGGHGKQGRAQWSRRQARSWVTSDGVGLEVSRPAQLPVCGAATELSADLRLNKPGTFGPTPSFCQWTKPRNGKHSTEVTQQVSGANGSSRKMQAAQEHISGQNRGASRSHRKGCRTAPRCPAARPGEQADPEGRRQMGGCRVRGGAMVDGC